MSSFKFAKKKLAFKDLYRQKQVTDIFTIDVSKKVSSHRVSCNNEKDLRYIVRFQVDGETIIPRFIKAPKNIFSYEISQYDKNSAHTMSLNISEVKMWVLYYRNNWKKFASTFVRS